MDTVEQIRDKDRNSAWYPGVLLSEAEERELLIQASHFKGAGIETWFSPDLQRDCNNPTAILNVRFQKWAYDETPPKSHHKFIVSNYEDAKQALDLFRPELHERWRKQKVKAKDVS